MCNQESQNLSLWSLRYSSNCAVKSHPFTCSHLLQYLSSSQTSARKMVREIFHQQSAKDTYKRLVVRRINLKKSLQNQKKTKETSEFMKTFGFLHRDFQEQERTLICQTKVSVPRSSRKAIKLCKIILKQSKKKYYYPLLNIYCPLVLPNNFSDDIIAQKSTQELVEENARYLEMDTSKTEVFLFLRAVIRRILPMKETWGCGKNESLFLKHIKSLLTMRAYDKISVEEMVDGLITKDIPWLSNGHRLKMLKTFVFWFLKDVLYVIIRHFFYITEHSCFRNRLVFYRKELWKSIVRNGVTILLNNKIWGYNLSTNKEGACFRCRFCPKSSSIRPIIYLPVAKMTNKPAGKMEATIVLKILQHICKKCPWLIGCAAQGIKEIHLKWNKFVTASQSTAHDLKLFFVKVDADRCFDRIPVDKLLEVLKLILQKAGSTKVSHLSPTYRKVFDCSEEILLFVQKSLENVSITCMGKKYAKLEGIPQGWCLSKILCDILYGDMEIKYFPSLASGTSSDLLVRFADDFLFVSSNQLNAENFLRTMHNGFPEYGCFINARKSQTNFLVSTNLFINCEKITEQQQASPFPWFGLLFPTCLPPSFKDGKISGGSKLYGVSLDLSRYKEIGSIRDCITVGSTIPCSIVSATLKRNLRLRLLPICFDPEINTTLRILRNIYEVALVIASQWIAHDLNRFPRRRLARRRTEALFGIELLAKAAFSRIRKQFPAKFPSRQVVLWIFYKAFSTKLKRRLNQYKSIVFHLSSVMQHQLYKTHHPQMQRLLKHSTAVFPDGLKHMSMK
uniref:Telomerase reverse transcriptase n=1 Tax=Phallusia mammillata TaxID=59560 RepID=A0A6F9DTZ8_9ASCI|nr:telomerase reverse transcriptase-like [Phallusia mammillata]